MTDIFKGATHEPTGTWVAPFSVVSISLTSLSLQTKRPDEKSRSKVRDYFSQVRHSLEGVAQKGGRGLHSQLPTQQRKDLNGTVFFFSP